MMQKFTYAQMTGLNLAEYQYRIARKLGTAHQTALEAAIAAFILATGMDRERAAHTVTAFIATQPELPGGSL